MGLAAQYRQGKVDGATVKYPVCLVRMKAVRLRALSSCLQTAILIRCDSRPSGIANAYPSWQAGDSLSARQQPGLIR